MQIKGSYLSDTRVGRFAQKLSHPLVSEVLILTSVCLFWYEGLLVKFGATFVTSIPLASVLLVLALVLADKTEIRITKSTILLILFSIWALVAGANATLRGIDGRLIVLGWTLLVQFLVALLAGQGTAKPQRLIRNLLFASIPMIAAGAYQLLTNQATSKLWVSPAESSISTRAFAFFGSPNVLGAVLVLLAFAAMGLYFVEKQKYFVAISLAAIAVTIFTFSRSAWMGLAAGLVFVLFIRNWKLVIWAPLATLVIFIPQIRDRLAVVFTSSYWLDSSLDGRLWALNNGFHIWAKHPLLGSGPGTYGGKLALNYASPVYLEGIQQGYVALYFTDNQWLQLLVQTGIVGLLLFALFAVNMLVELITKYNSGKRYLSLGVAGAFVAFLVTGFFGNVLEFGAIAVPMGIMLGVATSEK